MNIAHVKINKTIRNSQNSGSSVALLLNPDLAKKNNNRKGINFAQQNRAKLKLVQEKNRQLQNELEQQENKELFKLQRFKQVESTLKLNNNNNYNDDNNDQSNSPKQYLQRGKGIEAKKAIALKNQNNSINNNNLTGKIKSKPAVPTQQQLIAALNYNTQSSNQNKNFLAENAKSVVQSKPSKRDNSEDSVKHENYGRIPDYLMNRKAELDYKKQTELELQKEMHEKAKIPPGMKQMKEEERVETLRILEENRAAILNQLSAFPLAVETNSRKKAKAELEQKLNEIEAAIKLFNRKVVYITENQ